MEGRPYTHAEVEGKNMNNFDNPGLYVGIILEKLITEVVVCPDARDWYAKLVARIVDLSMPKTKVSLSSLKK